MTQVLSLLVSVYSQVQNQNNHVQSELFYTILQIKRDNRDNEDYEQSLYVDVKCFITAYIHSSKNGDYGYDEINLAKINFAIKCILSKTAQHNLAIFCIKELKACHHDELVDKFKADLNWYKLSMTLAKDSFWKWFESILQFSALNFLTITLTIFIFIFGCVLFLQDAFHPSLEFYKFHFEQFTPNLFWNKFLNVLAKPFGLAENFKVTPLNEIGLIILMIVKALYVIFIVNFLLERVKDYTKF